MRTRSYIAWIIFGVIVAIIGAWLSARPARAALPPDVPIVAFCGTQDYDGMWKLVEAGVDAMMGECREPMPGYTPATPMDRYMSPDEYLTMTLNADYWTNGLLKTVVYDPALTAPDRVTRALATIKWEPYRDMIWRIDLGDEYDPTVEEQWGDLVARWRRLSPIFTPYTNHLPWSAPPGRLTFQRATADMGSRFYSFDNYGIDATIEARTYDPLVGELMCYVHAFPYDRADFRHRADLMIEAGCDIIGMFGGAPVVYRPETVDRPFERSVT